MAETSLDDEKHQLRSRMKAVRRSLDGSFDASGAGESSRSAVLRNGFQLLSQLGVELTHDRRATTLDATLASKDNLATKDALASKDAPAKALGTYVAAQGELDPILLIEALLAQGWRVAVPVARKSQAMKFYECEIPAGLENGPFNVPEPIDRSPEKLLLPNLLLVPMLAFDELGFRLGYGGGFYDRTIAELRSRQRGQGRLWAIGVAFAEQQVAAVPRNEFDMPLDAIITPQYARRF